jgi:hypothetical protein
MQLHVHMYMYIHYMYMYVHCNQGLEGITTNDGQCVVFCKQHTHIVVEFGTLCDAQ